MNKDTSKFKINIILSIIFIILLIPLINNKFLKGKIKYNSTSNLINIEEVEDLYLTSFTWNGIAEKYKDEKKKEVAIYIKYNSNIEAIVNLKTINDNIQEDKSKKQYIITIPKIELKPNILVSDDSFSFIPDSTKIDLKEILTICEEDAKEEANNNKELIKASKENYKSTIKGLLLPIIEENGYKIVWKDGEE